MSHKAEDCTLIDQIHGFRIFENPVYGDEAPLLVEINGELVDTGLYDMDDDNEMLDRIDELHQAFTNAQTDMMTPKFDWGDIHACTELALESENPTVSSVASMIESDNPGFSEQWYINTARISLRRLGSNNALWVLNRQTIEEKEQYDPH